MPGPFWSEEEIALITKLWAHNTQQDIEAEFRKAGFNRGKLAIIRKAHQMKLKKTPTAMKRIMAHRDGIDDTIPIFEVLSWLPTFDKFETVRSECATVYSDPHIPYLDIDLAEKMCRLSQKWGCTDLILGGDTFNQDMFSCFVRYLEEKKQPSWSVEMEAASEFLKMVLKTFKNVWVTRGNHDERILRLLMGRIGLKHIFKWLDAYDEKRVHVSEYPYCYLISGGREFRITHPKSYSKIPTRVSSWLASKWQCSIMSAHGHRQGLVFSDYGHCAMDIGGGFDPKKIEYINMNDTTHGKWNPGFFIVRRGYPYMFSRDWTDWDYWLR